MGLCIDKRPRREFHRRPVGIPTGRTRLEPVEKEEPEREADMTGILDPTVRQKQGGVGVPKIFLPNSFSAKEDLGG